MSLFPGSSSAWDLTASAIVPWSSPHPPGQGNSALPHDKPCAKAPEQTLRSNVDIRVGGLMPLEDNVFNDFPFLLAGPRAAKLLGISRAAAYRLAASGDLPVRRLGGRVYVVTAGLRELAS